MHLHGLARRLRCPADLLRERAQGGDGGLHAFVACFGVLTIGILANWVCFEGALTCGNFDILKAVGLWPACGQQSEQFQGRGRKRC